MNEIILKDFFKVILDHIESNEKTSCPPRLRYLNYKKELQLFKNNIEKLLNDISNVDDLKEDPTYKNSFHCKYEDNIFKLAFNFFKNIFPFFVSELLFRDYAADFYFHSYNRDKKSKDRRFFELLLVFIKKIFLKEIDCYDEYNFLRFCNSFLKYNLDFEINSFFIKNLKNFEVLYDEINCIEFKYKKAPLIFMFSYQLVTNVYSFDSNEKYRISSKRVSSPWDNFHNYTDFYDNIKNNIMEFVSDELKLYLSDGLTEKSMDNLKYYVENYYKKYNKIKNIEIKLRKNNLFISKNNKSYMISLYDYNKSNKTYKVSKNLNLYFSENNKIYKRFYYVPILDKKYIDELLKKICL